MAHSWSRAYVVVVLVLSVAATALVDVEAWSAAMSCCAATDYDCATVGGPDDCCHQMGLFTGSVTAAPPSNAIDYGAMTCAVASAIDIPSPGSAARLLPPPTFKRPHDPPPLHPVPLRV